MGTLKLLARSLAEPLARALVHLGVSANALTGLSLLLNGVAAACVAAGALQLGGFIYLLFSGLDFLDGAVARLSGSAGPFGAFLDSVVDRASEAVLMIGLAYFYAVQQQPVMAALAGTAMTGSFMVSYARARAEGLGYDCEVGLLQRTERVLLLGLGLLLSGLHEAVLPLVLSLIVFATALTTVQRIKHVARLARQSGRAI